MNDLAIHVIAMNVATDRTTVIGIPVIATDVIAIAELRADEF